MIQVWDRWVRFCHWAVAGLVLGNLLNESGEPLHRYAGYIACGLVVSRLIWGGIASGYARFALWPSPKHCRTYVQALLKGSPPRYIGHNPIGALMAIILWTLVLGLAVTGWMMRLDKFWGEEWLEIIHAYLANVLWICIFIHVLGTAVMSWLHRENLITGMISGKKRGPTEAAPD